MRTAKVLCEIQDLIGKFSWERIIKVNGLLDSSISCVNCGDFDETKNTVVVTVIDEDERRIKIRIPGKLTKGTDTLWVSKSLEV